VAGENARVALAGGISRLGFVVLTGALLFGFTRETKPPFAPLLPLMFVLAAWLDVLTHDPGENPTAAPGVFQPRLARDRLAMSPQPELGGSRAMLAPATALELMRHALGDAKTNFLAKRMAYCADVNLLDGVPKVDGFFSLTPREFDWLLSAIYTVTNGDWLPLENFMGVSQYTSPTHELGWQARANSLPLITAGQRPVFMGDTNAIWEMAGGNFNGATVVVLPPETQPEVTVSHQTEARVVDPKFGNQTIDFGTDATAPSLAVIAQAYYHDWSAEVDGQAAPLLRANIAFQAVQVPAGAHRVHLFSRDRAFEIGAASSLCAWMICLAAYVVCWRRGFPG